MNKFKQNMKKNGLIALVIFLLYINATISGSLFHNHKPLACDNDSNTKEHTSCKDSCPVCSFLAVNHSTTIVDYPLFIAARLQTLLHSIPNIIIVKHNEWASSIILRAPPLFSF